MHPKYKKSHALSFQAIGAAIEVHRIMGPGLLESIYERCLLHELQIQGIPAQQQVVVPVKYKDLVFEESLRLDILMDDCLILELKSIEEVLPIHKAQLMSYMKLMNIPIGLIINFHESIMKDGIHRMILKGADAE